MMTIRNMAVYEGQLYTFKYTSWGGRNRGKRQHNKDVRPLLLLATRGGLKVWPAKNGQKYIYGFNLNYLPPKRRLTVIRRLKEIFAESPGIKFSYKDIRDHLDLDLPSSTDDTIFRKYDIRGSKLRVLKEVNLDTYESYLDASLDGRQ
tara:strand:- start:1269 stop:1712 length:444 start_codon:yes stop_codon:yes gene_type:complete